MNWALFKTVLSGLVTVAGTAAATTGVATTGEVSGIVNNATSAIGSLATIASLGYSIYRRLQPVQAASTAKLPSVAQVVMKDGTVLK